MPNVISISKHPKMFEVEYIYSGDVITGVTHPKWPYSIVRNGSQRGLVCKETDEVFGKLPKDDFNLLLACWLLIDGSELLDTLNINAIKE